jgi:hypothetical protein
MEHTIQEIIKIQQHYPNIYIGGSVALILQNAIPVREPKDVDLISPVKIHIYDIFNVNKNQHPRIRGCEFNNIRFELFINPDAQYVEYDYNGFILKLSPIQEITDWKLKQLNRDHNKKHLNDIEYLYT